MQRSMQAARLSAGRIAKESGVNTAPQMMIYWFPPGSVYCVPLAAGQRDDAVEEALEEEAEKEAII